MKYYIIAGEASGDMHAANLITALKNEDAQAEFRFWGGDKMIAASGVAPVKHIRDLAFMGFVEVVANLRTILRNISHCKKDILNYQPDALILVDYPGFNIRIAKWAKKQGLRNYYYISPQVWAWKSKRIHTIMKSVEKLYTILPFEKEFYKKYGYDNNVEYVGHPLLEEIKKSKFSEINSIQPIIALLPGSRKQEIKTMLPIMLEMVDKFTNYQFFLAAAPAIPLSFYQEIIKDTKVTIIENNTYSLLYSAHAALVTSGTATLETGLFQVPQVVCYKGHKLSYHIAKRLVKIEYISLVNLILQQPLVYELIQVEMNARNLKLELEKILKEEGRTKVIQGYQSLHDRLSLERDASECVAKGIVQQSARK